MILKVNQRSLAAFVMLLVTAASGQKTGSAIDQLRSLRHRLREAQSAKDWNATRAIANQLKEFLNGSPNSLLQAAKEDTLAGNSNAALQDWHEFVNMGQSTDLLTTSADFAPLRKLPEFRDLEKAMAANDTAVSLSSPAFQLPDPSLIAEDVDYDSQSKRFFVTSVRLKKIISTDAAGDSADFAQAPDGWPMLAIRVDTARGVLWATEVALQGYQFAPQQDWGKSVLLCYDLKNGKLLRRIEGPRPSALGDMVLTAQGDVIVSDGEKGGIYRLAVHALTLERLDSGDFVSPQTPAMDADGKHVFVPDYLRGIGILELATKQVRWLPMAGRFALDGIDGLYFDRGSLIAVQNGTSPERVVAFRLNSGFTKIESETLIERSTPTLGDPTHGVVVGPDFYYIANSGWDVIDDHGAMKPGAKTSTPRIMRVRLPVQ